MAPSNFNSKSPTIRRIMREAQELAATPSADYTATPLDSDLFEWHFTLRGPPNSAYAGGLYHGRIVLPPTYPLRPPSFRFVTPSGRFEANREICLSISGHHEETWQPAWGLRTALVALRSFMETDPRGQLGGLEVPDAVRRRLASESGAFRCAVCARSNADIMAESEAAALAHDAAAASSSSSSAAEVVVPADLKMGWRDEMEKEKKEKEKGAGGSGDGGVENGQQQRREEEEAEIAQLAEGFVQTVPVAPASTSDSTAAPGPVPVPVHTQSQIRARAQAQPAQMAPQPTRTVPLPGLAQQAQTQIARQSNDGIPAWIDRLIIVVSILLLVMVLRVFIA